MRHGLERLSHPSQAKVQDCNYSVSRRPDGRSEECHGRLLEKAGPFTHPGRKVKQYLRPFRELRDADGNPYPDVKQIADAWGTCGAALLAALKAKVSKDTDEAEEAVEGGEAAAAA